MILNAIYVIIYKNESRGNNNKWYELTRQLEYKAKWNDRIYVKIDTFYASSQLCSCCGYKNVNVKDLSVR